MIWGGFNRLRNQFEGDAGSKLTVDVEKKIKKRNKGTSS